MPPLVVVAGATATGKTALAIRLAEALAGEGRPAEVISADSRQVYRGLDIGTAKASPTDRGRVRHHGLDLVDPDQPFSVSDFTEHALTALAKIAEQKGVAILVGGTGLYLRAVARGIDMAALPHDPETRAALEHELAAEGLDTLSNRLIATAPRLAQRTDLRNPRRVVRALEIATLQGDRPLPPPTGYAGPIIWFGLSVEANVHRTWITRRAEGQFAAGLLDEAAALRRRFDPGLAAFSAIGYREAWAVLDDRLSLVEAIELDARRNVAFAKRQRTWFRAEPGITWIQAGERDPLMEPLALVRAWLDG